MEKNIPVYYNESEERNSRPKSKRSTRAIRAVQDSGSVVVRSITRSIVSWRREIGCNREWSQTRVGGKWNRDTAPLSVRHCPPKTCLASSCTPPTISLCDSPSHSVEVETWRVSSSKVMRPYCDPVVSSGPSRTRFRSYPSPAGAHARHRTGSGPIHKHSAA
jgi:hypothetical protein